MLRRFVLTVAYDGSGYYGWQKQADKTYPTVQETLENALSEFFGCHVGCIGASRTDRGVHSMGQRALIEVDTTIPAEKLPLALQKAMPEDIAIVGSEEVDENFHPRYDCKYKIYEYKIYCGKYNNPVYRKYSEFCRFDLDAEKMNEAAQAFVGTHDFKAFAASGNSSQTTVRTIFEASVFKKDDFIVIRLKGDGFLYNMVRIIAGTLILSGKGKLDKKNIEYIIESRDRAKAGKTVGPEGLTLMKIVY